MILSSWQGSLYNEVLWKEIQAVSLIGRVIRFEFEFFMYHDDGPGTKEIIETTALLEKVVDNTLYLFGGEAESDAVPCRNIKTDIKLVPPEEEIVWKLEHNM